MKKLISLLTIAISSVAVYSATISGTIKLDVPVKLETMPEVDCVVKLVSLDFVSDTINIPVGSEGKFTVTVPDGQYKVVVSQYRFTDLELPVSEYSGYNNLGVLELPIYCLHGRVLESITSDRDYYILESDTLNIAPGAEWIIGEYKIQNAGTLIFEDMD
ncbi:MAG: hypothetical protein Kapaf2KO_09780 [Candidatus Kapaibacteriales bacterium]